MPPKRNPVVPAATWPARIVKTKGGKLITAAVRGAGRQPAPTPPPRESASPPPFDVDALGVVISTLPQIQGLDNRFRNLESIIDENQCEFRSSLQDTFTQFMNRFDALEQRGARSTPRTPIRQSQSNPVPFGAPRDVLFDSLGVVPPHRHLLHLSYRPPYRRPPASNLTSLTFLLLLLPSQFLVF